MKPRNGQSAIALKFSMFRGNCIGGKARTGGDFIHVTLSGKIGRPMELRDPIRSVLKHKGGNVWAVPPSASVYDAIAMMGEKQVGALLVIEDAKLVGILSERDYARKIILKGRSSKETPVGEIVTSPMRYVTPQETVDECMRIMTASRVRHLPVVEDDKVVGIVSIGDLVNWIISAQADTIHQLHSYITGKYPG
jgi:CBS domain-containing protein